MWKRFPRFRLYHLAEAPVKDKEEHQQYQRVRSPLPAPGLLLWLCLSSALITPAMSAPQRWTVVQPPAREVRENERVPLPTGTREDANLTRLFTPARPARGVYSVYVSEAPLEKCLEHFRSLPRRGEPPPGAWVAERMEPLAAFGASGP